MHFYNKIIKTLTICLYLFLLSVMCFSLVGFRDATSEEVKKNGVKCAFKARIIEKVTDPKGEGLVVIKKYDIEKNKANERGQGKKNEESKNNMERMYVLVTDDTELDCDFNELKVDMSVLIEGIRVLKKVDDQEIMVVWAKSIEPVE
jgi:hypothetical protein